MILNSILLSNTVNKQVFDMTVEAIESLADSTVDYQGQTVITLVESNKNLFLVKSR